MLRHCRGLGLCIADIGRAKGDVRRTQRRAQHHRRQPEGNRCLVRPRRMQGGGARPDMQSCPPDVIFDAQQVVYGVLLSKYGDAQKVTQMFRQDWVREWQGWLELSEAATDAEYMDAATRFERVAQANWPVQMKTNAARLEELAEAGLTLVPASPHGVNNCLIDSVLLGLVAGGALGLPAPRHSVASARLRSLPLVLGNGA